MVALLHAGELAKERLGEVSSTGGAGGIEKGVVLDVGV